MSEQQEAKVIGVTQPYKSACLTLIPDGELSGWARGDSSGFQVFVMGSPVQPETNWHITPVELAGLVTTLGPQFVQSLVGDFAVVIETPDKEVLLYSDRFASRRFYYAQCAGRLLVSDGISGVLRELDGKPSISHKSIINYLFYHMIPSPDTIYETVSSSSPAEEICWSAANGGSIKHIQRYWKPTFEDSRDRTENECAEELFEILKVVTGEQAESRAAQGAESVGCFLSGGLDSSSVSGLVAMRKPHVDAFSIGFPLEQYNEIAYARTAVKHFGLQGHEYFMTPEDVVTALPLIAGSMSQPFGNSSVMPAYYCAKMAREAGMNRLIAGDGGDELFAGNARYSHQLKMERWRRSLGPLVGLLDMGLNDIPWPDVTPFSKGRSFTKQLQMGVPERLEYFNFMNLIDRDSIFSDQLSGLAGQYRPESEAERVYDTLPEASDLNRMLYLDWKHTLADNDLVKVNSMCHLAGVDVSFPMLDYRLVDFSLRVPSAYKLKPRNLRHLYKLSMQRFLPDKIINKPKHGFGLPFGIWTAEHKQLRDLAYESIDSLNKYDLFRPGFIDEVKRQHQEVHAKHYGELIWVLMILALWLDGHDS